MPSFVLHCEDRASKTFAVGSIVTIGRLPDNTIAIDSPAVSGHHACVVRDGDDFILEDLESTNGTLVNGKRVSRHTLQNGDVVKIGKHRLAFDRFAGAEPAAQAEVERIMSNPGDTVFLDAGKHQALLAMLSDADGEAAADAVESAQVRVGVLRVVDGRADQTEYRLQAHTSFIGKADRSLVRLKGWFKPSVAVIITRNGQAYTATLLRKSTLINGQPLKGRHDLKTGDVLRVGGLTLEFGLKG